MRLAKFLRSRGQALRWLRQERGSAVVEFIGASVLVFMLMLMVFQVFMFLYVRTVAIDALAQGAQLAARYDTTMAEGIARAEQILINNFGSNYAGKVTSAQDSQDSEQVVTLTTRMQVPFLGFAGIPDAVEVSGSAPIETMER